MKKQPPNKDVPVALLTLESFEKTLNREKPILLLCMSRRDQNQEQLDILTNISKEYGGILEIYQLAEEFIGPLMEKLGFSGTPTFFIFSEGKEKGRLLGVADESELKDFLFRTLPFLQDDQ